MPPASPPTIRPAAIIFDLDGTLVDTVGTRIAAWSRVFAERGIRVEQAHLASLIGSDGRRLAREVALAAGRPLAPGDDEAIDARCGAIFSELNRTPQPTRGALELLAFLDAGGLAWAIATSSRREQVAASVAALRLSRPPRVVDGSGVAHAKPAPDLLLAAAAAIGVAPSACWYVGDATPDMLAAVAAGMRGIGVMSGAVDAPTLRGAGADLVVASLAEIAGMLAGEG